MSADRERTAVYSAEAVAFEGTDLESVVEFDELAGLISLVVDGDWWPGPPVRVVRARRDASSSSARGGGTSGELATIRLAAEQCTVATAAHELAHVLAGLAAGHGASFRAALLDVITVITNLDPAHRRGSLHLEQLRDAFRSAGITIGERRWPVPPTSIPGAIAL